MLAFYLLVFSVLKVAAAEDFVATSTHEMARVLEGEDHLIQDLRLYTKALEDKLATIQLFLDDASKRQQEAQTDPIEYASNPLNSLPTMRRMHEDAEKLFSYLKLEPGADHQKIADYNLEVVTKLGLDSAATGLLRIQNIYDLDERQMAQGLLAKKQFNAELNTLDCFALGSYLRTTGDNELATRWFKVALEQYDSSQERIYGLLQLNRSVIWRELGLIQEERGDWQGTWAAFSQVLQYATDGNVKQEANRYLSYAKRQLAHLRICRGESQLPVSSSLRCLYNANTTPFLRLAPLKLEQLSIDPYVAIYHDVIYATEMQNIIELAKPRLRRAWNRHYVETAMTAFLALNRSRHLQSLQRRIEDMSGFDLSHVQYLAVKSYGIGGEGNIHLDCWHSKYNDIYKESIGHNRIGTVLIYLSDVQLGGLTSFPDLGLGIRPIKGAAVLWHNMRNAVECDEQLIHGACPVLLGAHWVATQWIPVIDQWRRRPCAARE